MKTLIFEMIKSLHSKNDDHLIEIYLGSNPGPNFSTSLVILSIASEYAFSVPEKLLIVSRTTGFLLLIALLIITSRYRARMIFPASMETPTYLKGIICAMAFLKKNVDDVTNFF